MTTFIVHHDILIIIIISILLGIGISCMTNEGDFFFPVFLLCGVFLTVASLIHSSSVKWEDAKVCQIMPVAELKQIEMPDNTIQIWHNGVLITTIKNITDYLRRDQIDHIEFRCLEVFGPDFYQYKIIYKK